jgi:hypothetical protein
MSKLAAIVMGDVSSIPLLAAVEASTVVTTSSAGITLASAKATTTKTVILTSTEAITKASTEAGHCVVQVEVSLNRLLKDFAQRLAAS